jgi:hypothetical protein
VQLARVTNVVSRSPRKAYALMGSAVGKAERIASGVTRAIAPDKSHGVAPNIVIAASRGISPSTHLRERYLRGIGLI